MDNLCKENTPKNFWQIQLPVEDEIWQQAAEKAFAVLNLPGAFSGMDQVNALTLGEEQFGPDRYNLSRVKRMYYDLKPLLPRFLINLLKKIVSKTGHDEFRLNWPAEERYVQFQWEVMKNVLLLTGQTSVQFRHFWPEGKKFAFVLTHDVETGGGQSFIREVADLEERLGFRSSFNFVPERYPLDFALMDELRGRGFEIGVHGLKHDGKLFFSKEEFLRRAEKINHYLAEFDAVGFRSPLTHRNPEWMQALALEYDLSFFDTDPYEPVAGGTMSIWPFRVGNFLELPYTLVQDSTLRYTLEASDPGLWLEKVKYLEQYYGMALLNSHPDYLKDTTAFQMYADFLHAIKHKPSYWHALPKDVASWWKKRSASAAVTSEAGAVLGTAEFSGGHIQIR